MAKPRVILLINLILLACAAEAGTTGTLVTVASGNHYDSMINEGIPAGIRWAKSLPGFAAAPKP